MRKRNSYRVCRCTPKEGVVQLETQLLRQVVNYRIRSIRCAQNTRMKYHYGLHLGQLCATTGHLWWAIKVWQFTLSLMCGKDYTDWIYVPVNPDYIRIDSVLSEPESMDLGRRIDCLWQKMGHPECAVMERHAQSEYDFFWAEKYDYCRVEEEDFLAELMAIEKQRKTDALFREGQGVPVRLEFDRQRTTGMQEFEA